MNCPKCGKSMLIKEVLDLELSLAIKIAVCNNFKDCDFDEEIIIGEDNTYYSHIEAGN